MSIEDRILSRINELLAQAASLSRGNENDQVISSAHQQGCAGWIASAVNSICLVCSQPSNPYRIRAEAILARGADYVAHQYVGELASLLINLKADAEAGMLSSIANQARAETFDNFLDHGAEYLKRDRAKEAGVIAGVVFEDTVRQICRKHEIEERGEKLDLLISSLNKQGVLSDTKAKRARASADVRTKATHAQWDEFDRRDVQSCIDLTRELVTGVLDA